MPQLMKLIICILLLANLSQINAEYPRCFSFTWLGPSAHKESIHNESCDSRVETYTHLPCQEPLVYTSNDNLPNTLAIWKNSSRDAFMCYMEPGWSCVKYSYIFKSGIQNITYMCARVNATNGCYRETQLSGMEIEACVCTSRAGQLPCNYASKLRLPALYALIGLFVVLTRYKIT